MKTLPKTLAEVITAVALLPASRREDYTWYYLRELTLHTASENHLARMAHRVLTSAKVLAS